MGEKSNPKIVTGEKSNSKIVTEGKSWTTWKSDKKIAMDEELVQISVMNELLCEEQRDECPN